MVAGMDVMLFMIGVLLGLVGGSALCIRYLRQEMTARIGPSIELLRLQLDNVQSGVNLALANWHAELHDHSMARAEWERGRRVQPGGDPRDE